MHLKLFDGTGIDPLARLVVEVQRDYNFPSVSLKQVRRDLSNLPAGVEILVAHDKKLPIGLAVFSTLYHGPKTRPQLYLKELFVSQSFRGKGIGQKLMRQLASIACRRGYNRIDWTASANSPAVRRFYERLGARPQLDKIFYRLDGKALIAAAGKRRS